MLVGGKYSIRIYRTHLGRIRQVLLATVLRHLLAIIREGGEEDAAAGKEGVAEVLTEALGHLRGSQTPVDRTWPKIVANGLELSECESRGEVSSDSSSGRSGGNEAIVPSDSGSIHTVDGGSSRGRRGGCC